MVGEIGWLVVDLVVVGGKVGVVESDGWVVVGQEQIDDVDVSEFVGWQWYVDGYCVLVGEFVCGVECYFWCVFFEIVEMDVGYLVDQWFYVYFFVIWCVFGKVVVIGVEGWYDEQGVVVVWGVVVELWQ